MLFPGIVDRRTVLAGIALVALVVIALIYFVGSWIFGLLLSPDSPPNVQIVLDRSIVMEGPFGNGTKAEAAIQVIDKKILASEVGTSSNLSFREYGGPCDGDNTQLRVEFGPENQENIRNALGVIVPSGETTFVDGAIQAIRDFNKAPGADEVNNAMIVITGGGDSCRLEESSSRIRQEIDRLGVPVNVRIIGLDVPMNEQPGLDELALALSGGTPLYVDSLIGLNGIMSELLADLEAGFREPPSPVAPGSTPAGPGGPPIEETKGVGIIDRIFRTAQQHYNAGVHLQNQGRLEEAIAEYNEAIRIDPKYTLAYDNRGAAYIELGQPQRAVSDLEEAIRLDPKFALAHYNLGRAHYLLGQFDQAIQEFNAAINIDPQYALAYNNRGLAYTDKGEYQQAASDLEKAISLDPQNALAYYNLGRAHYLLKQFGQAVTDYSESIDLDAGFDQVYAARAMAYTLLWNDTAAQQDIDQAVILGSDRDQLEQIIEQLKQQR